MFFLDIAPIKYFTADNLVLVFFATPLYLIPYAVFILNLSTNAASFINIHSGGMVYFHLCHAKMFLAPHPASPLLFIAVSKCTVNTCSEYHTFLPKFLSSLKVSRYSFLF